MSLRLSKGAFSQQCQGYICLSCRQGNATLRSYWNFPYQHAATSPIRGSSFETSIIPAGPPRKASSTNVVATAPSREDGSSTEGAASVASTLGDREQIPVAEVTSISPQATKLQEQLQRQYAERRRQNMAKLGSRQTPAAGTKIKEGDVVTSTTKLPDKQKKSASLSRRTRAKKSKSSKIRAKIHMDDEDTSKGIKKVVQDLETKSNYRQAPEDNGSGDPAVDPFAKLHADVQKLKKALEANEKAKRVSQIQFSKLQAPKDQADLAINKAGSGLRSSKRAVQKAVLEGVEKVSAPSKSENVAMVPQATELAGKILKEAASRKTGAYRSVPNMKRVVLRAKRVSKGEEKPSRKPREKILVVPRRVGSGKNTLIEVVHAETLELSAVEINQPPVPSLSYGLERVLFNPGVYHLQDPRSRVYNFDPYLQKIMPVTEFNFAALKAYVTSSGDETLKQIAQKHSKRYFGSTSSMTSILAHFHFLLSQWREIGTKMLSNEFPQSASKNFTIIQRAPIAIFLRWQDGAYAIDADKQYANANVLMMLGKSMEKLLTLEKEGFEKYRKSSGEEIPKEVRNAPESYHYSTMGDFLMRSQLDAHDARLPGTGMFDLKTRAVVSVRMDAQKVERGRGYQIKTRQGEWESYEREYYDMIRSAMLKYSLQVRMGRMDGIFVAYHNTQRIFGFQYISLAEMDAALHGQWETTLGDQQFRLSLDLLNKVLDRATKKYPEQSLRIHFETRDAQTPFMYIFAEPVTDEQIQEIQSENDAEIAEYERSVLGLHKDPAEDSEHEDDGKWADMQADVEEEMDRDEGSLTNLEAEHNVAAETANKEETVESLTQESLFDSIETKNVEHNFSAAASEDEDGGQDSETKLDILDENGVKDTTEDKQQTEKSSIELSDSADGDGTPVNAAEITKNSEDKLDNTRNLASKADLEGMSRASQVATGSDSRDDVGQHLDHPSLAGNQSGLSMDYGTSSAADVPFLEAAAKAAPTIPDSREVLAMTLTIRNKVNDQYVLRPEGLTTNDRWSVEYAIAEVDDENKAWGLYEASQSRRKKALEDDDDDENDDNQRLDWYMRNLRELSEKGEKWRQEQDELDRNRPTIVLGRSSPYS